MLRVAFSPDGRWLASTGSDAAVTIWDLATCKPHIVLRNPHSAFHDIAYNPDGRLLATAHDDGTVRVWNVTRLLEAGGP